MKAKPTNNQIGMSSIRGARTTAAPCGQSPRWNTSGPPQSGNITLTTPQPTHASTGCLETGRSKRVESKGNEVDTSHHGHRRETTAPQIGSVQRRCN
jgi:hypothetical protein